MVYQTFQPNLEKKVLYMDASIYINLLERDIEILEQINERYYILYSLPIKMETEEWLTTQPENKALLHQKMNIGNTLIPIIDHYQFPVGAELVGNNIAGLDLISSLGEEQKYINNRYSQSNFTKEEREISLKLRKQKLKDNTDFVKTTQKTKPNTQKNIENKVLQEANYLGLSINRKSVKSVLQPIIDSNIDKLYTHTLTNESKYQSIERIIMGVFQNAHYDYHWDIMPMIQCHAFHESKKRTKMDQNNIKRFLTIMYYFYTLEPEHDTNIHATIYINWCNQNCPPIKKFAPYTDYLLKTHLATTILSNNRLIRTKEKAHIYTDMQYLTYLPFCNIFITEDKDQMALARSLIKAADLDIDIMQYSQINEL